MSSLLRIARPAAAVAARSVRPSAIQFAPLQVAPQLAPARSFARAKGLAGRGGRKATRPRARAAAVATVDEDPWTAVKDEQSGLIYYWNEKTDETTALGEPKPTGVYAPAPAAGGEMQQGDALQRTRRYLQCVLAVAQICTFFVHQPLLLFPPLPTLQSPHKSPSRARPSPSKPHLKKSLTLTPTPPAAHGPGGPGLMGVMKEGMAFGAGAAVARMAVGSIADSMFGGDTGLGDMGDGGDDGENIV